MECKACLQLQSQQPCVSFKPGLAVLGLLQELDGGVGEVAVRLREVVGILSLERPANGVKGLGELPDQPPSSTTDGLSASA